MSDDNIYKLYEVLIPVMGTMRLHLRAKDRTDALNRANIIAEDMRKDSSDTIIPNLCNWQVIKSERRYIIEKGEADE